jgi:hypothetical protein
MTGLVKLPEGVTHARIAIFSRALPNPACITLALRCAASCGFGEIPWHGTKDCEHTRSAGQRNDIPEAP